MGAGRPAVRLFLFLLVAALPPLVAFAAVSTFATSWLERIGPGTVLLVVALFAIIWAAVVSVLGGRGMRDDAQALVAIATGSAAEPASTSPAVERLAIALDERNRQIAELAAHVRAAPIEEDAQAVARSTVSSATSVTHDPTWSLVVFRSPDETHLPTGVYTAESTPPGTIEDVHGWAATVDHDEESVPSVSHASGPWGAFVVVEVAAGDVLRASLLAPWEGRDSPSRAERELLSLLGQNSATAIEHALLYERLRSQTEELNRMATIQSDFLRGVTHDLQTPLTSIRALAAELADQPEISTGGRQDLATISHQADRLRRMVAQLLVASRLEVGALQPRQEVMRVTPLVDRTWSALRADRPFRLKQDGPELLAVGDPDRLEQVLWALLDNAVKYSPPGSPIVVRISGFTSGQGARCCVDVRDEGSGMDDETQRQAFAQFFRSDSARRMAPDGSGVGLYAARGIIEAMGGTIELDSRLGKGTTVRIELPAEVVSETPPETAEST